MSRILVTDDNSDYRQSILEILRLEGYDVFEAADGAEAVDLALSQSPDLILCDVDMPVMDGFAVLAIIKKEFPHIPFLLVTGHDDQESREQGLQLGADDYLIKPMKIEILLEKLNAYLTNED
jgi:CheY-like chemotaxis protein